MEPNAVPEHLTENEQSTEQERTHTAEVILGLEGEQGQPKEDAQRDEAMDQVPSVRERSRMNKELCLQGLHDNIRRVKGGDDAERERLHKRECRQEDEVPGVAVTLPVEKAEVD